MNPQPQSYRSAPHCSLLRSRSRCLSGPSPRRVSPKRDGSRAAAAGSTRNLVPSSKMAVANSSTSSLGECPRTRTLQIFAPPQHRLTSYAITRGSGDGCESSQARTAASAFSSKTAVSAISQSCYRGSQFDATILEPVPNDSADFYRRTSDNSEPTPSGVTWRSRSRRGGDGARFERRSTLVLLGMKGLAWMRPIDCLTSSSRLPKAPSANAGRTPTSNSIFLLTSSSLKVSMPQSVW